MGLGILESRSMDHVPGTTRYFDDPERPQYAADGTHGLKCDTSGAVPIILVPQPSDDSNDPLNWPLWKRDMITFTLSMAAIFATALGPILACNTFTLQRTFGVTFASVAELTGWYLLGVGAAAFLFVPSGRIWGKRHLFVTSCVLLVITSAWGGASNTPSLYRSQVAARVWQGIATAPFECFVNAIVADLYFVHERGKRMAFTNLAVFGGAFMTPILVGKITTSMGWEWSFYWIAIFCAIILPAIFFLCPETAYRRDSSLNLDMLATDPPTERSSAGDTGSHETRDDLEKVGDSTSTMPPPTGDAPAAHKGTNGAAGMTSTSAPVSAPPVAGRQKATFAQSLALFNGRKTDDVFWKLLLRPIVLFAHPAFLWASITQGLLIGWTVFIGVLISTFLQGSPLWWMEDKVGYTYTAPFLGALIGFMLAGALADWSAKVMTKWNGGVYEPEFRIVLVIPQLLLGCAGLYGFGTTIDGLSEGKYSVYVPLAFFLLEVAGMVVGAVASSLYIVDAYRGLAIEGLTCMIIFKNIFSFALAFKAFGWLIQNHVQARPMFNALGSVQLVACLLSIPMYVYGKRLRSFSYRHDLLALCRVR
ncbi:major facilitator superfamily domain-containing protein [Apodospora peruviana]|uniref:Major facilitator superfamily domain-containing protein n=1 Tax=Apodospora peruviana TaxID=516989 RepID=A0AAE0I5M4_9PEZI|nr:major facilitator superfamily domain-containing protein [Apodospora peruviana]